MFDGNGFHGFGAEHGLPISTVISFAEDSTGALWLANDNGVFRREQEQNFAEVKDAAGQPIRGIGCMKGDTDGSVWLGSVDRGLLRWKAGRLASIDAHTGLPVSAVHGLVEDGEGFFWMTSDRSIVRARRSDLQAAADGRTARLVCQVFDESDGLPKGEFTSGRQPVCARDARGRLWFAMTRGVAMTEPTALQLNPAPPPVRVEEISFYRPAPPATNHSVPRQRREEIQSQLSGPFAAPLVAGRESSR
jgi:ligand-binding sensor domain-containing protein